MQERPINFIIKNEKNEYLKDYKLYFKKTLLNTTKKYLISFLLVMLLYFIIFQFFEWYIIEGILGGLIIYILINLAFRVYDLINFEKKLNIYATKLTFGKINLSIEPTCLKIDEYGLKRVIFISQLKKCLIYSDIIFFVEKSKKYIPFKVSKKEMSDGAFEALIKKLESLKIKIEE